MPTNLSIKNVPDRLMTLLRKQTAKHHQPLQGAVLLQGLGYLTHMHLTYYDVTPIETVQLAKQ